MRLAVISDIHFAGAMEKTRADYPCASIRNPWRRFLTRQFRHWIWHRDPFAHNHLLDSFLNQTEGFDLVVANGDYSCDSAGIGLADDAALESAHECLDRLRRRAGSRLRAVIGDHEIGKKMMSSGIGGLRLEGLRRARNELGLEPFWQCEAGRFVLMGVTSSLVALPVYATEALAGELDEWKRLRAEHLAAITSVFARLDTEQRVILFCHDPTALPFLWQEPSVHAKTGQIERTIIGHLHSNLVLEASRWLSGMPPIHFLGHTPRRLSLALREARFWRPFKPLLCPSTCGIQLLKDGGYLVANLAADGPGEVQFRKCPLPW